MSTVIVIGATGFLGRNLVAALGRSGREVIAVSKSGGPVDGAESAWAMSDIANLGRLPDGAVVVHLAAHRYVASGFTDGQADILSANVALANEVYGFCAARGIKEVRLASSVAVYPAAASVLDDSAPVDLNAPPHAGEAFYAWSKRWAEIVAGLARQRWGIATLAFRLSNPYGPHDSLDPAAAHVLPAFVMRALGPGDVFHLRGDPEVGRDFIFVDDAVRVFEASLAWRDRHDAFNLCTGHTTSLRDLASTVLSQAGSAKTLDLEESFTPAAVRARPSTSDRVQQAFGIERFTPLAEGLAPTIAWYRRALHG